MIRKFRVGAFLIMLAVTAVTLMAGCSKKENVVSEKEVEEKTPVAQPKQVDVGPKQVKLETSMGDIFIELNEEAAPVTVKNFLRYVEEGFYNGTIFHRVIRNFMIQAGGFTVDMKEKETHRPIINEFRLSNLRGTVAMAKLGGNPNSATSQFFINLRDNSRNLDRQNGGFTVFGKVVEGMNLVDAIAKVKTGVKTRTMRARDGSIRKSPMRDVPLESVVIKSAKVVSGK